MLTESDLDAQPRHHRSHTVLYASTGPRRERTDIGGRRSKHLQRSGERPPRRPQRRTRSARQVESGPGDAPGATVIVFDQAGPDGGGRQPAAVRHGETARRHAPRPGRHPAAWSPPSRRSCPAARAPGSAGPGSPDVTLEPTTTDGLSLHPVTADRRRRRQLLRGLLQRDPVAAVPRRGRRVAVPPRLVGGLPAGQRAVRRGGRRAGRTGRDRLGARLPAATGAAVAAPAAAGRADRLLPAHPVPAGRAVHAAAVAHPDRQRACSAPT